MDLFSLERFGNAVPQILGYLGLTFEFMIICVIGVTVLAVVLAVIRMKDIVVVKQFLKVYVSYMRGTPMLVQMLVVYYGLPMVVNAVFHVNINRWDAIIFASIAVILNESAYYGEIVKAAMEAIPRVQIEAAYSVGMTGTQTFFRVTLPQTVKILIPTYGQMVIGLFQSTSLLYLVGVTDMMARAQAINATSHHALEAYTVVGMIYVIFSILLKLLFRKAEIKMEYGRR